MGYVYIVNTVRKFQILSALFERYAKAVEYSIAYIIRRSRMCLVLLKFNLYTRKRARATIKESLCVYASILLRYTYPYANEISTLEGAFDNYWRFLCKCGQFKIIRIRKQKLAAALVVAIG